MISAMHHHHEKVMTHQDNISAVASLLNAFIFVKFAASKLFLPLDVGLGGK